MASIGMGHAIACLLLDSCPVHPNSEELGSDVDLIRQVFATTRHQLHPANEPRSDLKYQDAVQTQLLIGYRRHSSKPST